MGFAIGSGAVVITGLSNYYTLGASKTTSIDPATGVLTTDPLIFTSGDSASGSPALVSGSDPVSSQIETTVGGNIEFPMGSFRIETLDRLGWTRSKIGTALANVFVSNAEYSISHSAVTLDDAGDWPSGPGTYATGGFFYEVGAVSDTTSKYYVNKTWTESPATMNLSIALCGIFKEGSDLVVRPLGGGGIAMGDFENGAASERLAIDVSGYIKAYLDYKNEAVAFTHFVIPTEIEFDPADIDDPGSAASIVEQLTVSESYTPGAYTPDAGPPTQYVLLSATSFKLFSWSGFSIDSMNFGLDGTIKLPTNARPHIGPNGYYPDFS